MQRSVPQTSLILCECILPLQQHLLLAGANIALALSFDVCMQKQCSCLFSTGMKLIMGVRIFLCYFDARSKGRSLFNYKQAGRNRLIIVEKDVWENSNLLLASKYENQQKTHAS
jgi:hypothetical protein